MPDPEGPDPELDAAVDEAMEAEKRRAFVQHLQRSLIEHERIRPPRHDGQGGPDGRDSQVDFEDPSG